MQVLHFRPDGWDFGVYRLVVQLDPEESDLVRAAPPLPFALPIFRTRPVTADEGFQTPALACGPDPVGILDPVHGWVGSCTTTVDELRNPTPIQLVARMLEANVRLALDKMREWAAVRRR